jgi:2'-5' RNA ligase
MFKKAFEFQTRLAGAYNPDEDYSGKYMTAFYFKDDQGIPHCHVTHKYLDKQSDEDVEEIIEIIDSYFKDKKPKVDKYWYFDKFSLFGKEKDCPVMERRENDDMMLDLKKDLGKFKEESFPTYKPHLTLGDKMDDLDLDMITPYEMEPVEYALVTGDKKVKVWKL